MKAHLSKLSVLNNCAVAAKIFLESLQNLLVIYAFLKTLRHMTSKEQDQKPNDFCCTAGPAAAAHSILYRVVTRSPARLSSSSFRCVAGYGCAHNLCYCCRLSQRLQKHLQNHKGISGKHLSYSEGTFSSQQKSWHIWHACGFKRKTKAC